MDTPPRRPAAAPAAPAAGQGGTTGRIPWWDNARFTAATLIVVLHTVGSIMARHDGLHALNTATWALRVPLFVVLAGVFSSAGPLDGRRMQNLIRSVMVPAALFSLLFSLESHWLGRGFQLHLTQLPWTLWFLMSLFCWRLLLPLVTQFRRPLLVTTAAALAAGYVDTLGLAFSASRTVVYLPLFYLGWRIGQGAADRWFAARWSLPAAVGGLCAWGVFALFAHREIKGSWLSMRHSYTAEPLVGLYGAWVIRLGLLAAAAGLVLCVLRVMPRRRIPVVTTLGSAGFTIYLLHPLVILPVREAGWIDRVNTPVEQAGLVLCGVALALVLGSPPVRRLFLPLTRPPLGRLLVPLSAPRAAPPVRPTAPPAPPVPPVRPVPTVPGQRPGGAAGAGSAGRSSWSGSSRDGGA